MRREFDLPEGDRESLDARGLPWETILQNGKQWLLVHKFPVPSGYQVREATVALLIESGYPDTRIDMAYFLPALELVSGKSIGALTNEAIDGQNYQRWSRHHSPENPWRSGVDCVPTHLLQVEAWLQREVG